MGKKRKRVDTEGAGEPLPDDRFSALAALKGDPLPSHKEPAAAPSKPKRPFTVARTRKGGFPVFLEKRAKGKVVTVIRNVTGDLEGLLRTLKKRCGAGGVIRDGAIEIQGDHREAVTAFLRDQ